MESNEATEFRSFILSGDWEQAEASLYSLGVTDSQSLHVSYLDGHGLRIVLNSSLGCD